MYLAEWRSRVDNKGALTNKNFIIVVGLQTGWV
jgi:hypothetical protein